MIKNSHHIILMNGKKTTVKLAVSKKDYDRFNAAKDTKRYAKVCIEIVNAYSTSQYPPK